MEKAHHDDQSCIALSKYAVPDKLRGVLLHKVADAPLVGQLLICIVPGPDMQMAALCARY